MKKASYLIFLKSRHIKEKYLAIITLLFFGCYPIFALSENTIGTRSNTVIVSQKSSKSVSLSKEADSLFKQTSNYIRTGSYNEATVIAKEALALYVTIGNDKSRL